MDIITIQQKKIELYMRAIWPDHHKSIVSMSYRQLPLEVIQARRTIGDAADRMKDPKWCNEMAQDLDLPEIRKQEQFIVKCHDCSTDGSIVPCKQIGLHVYEPLTT